MKNKIYLTVCSDFHIEIPTKKEQNNFNKIVNKIYNESKNKIGNPQYLISWNEAITKAIANKMNYKIVSKNEQR